MNRSRLASTAAAALALVLSFAAPAGAQAEGLEVRNVDAGAFPLVRAIVYPAVTPNRSDRIVVAVTTMMLFPYAARKSP